MLVWSVRKVDNVIYGKKKISTVYALLILVFSSYGYKRLQ